VIAQPLLSVGSDGVAVGSRLNAFAIALLALAVLVLALKEPRCETTTSVDPASAAAQQGPSPQQRPPRELRKF